MLLEQEIDFEFILQLEVVIMNKCSWNLDLITPNEIVLNIGNDLFPSSSTKFESTEIYRNFTNIIEMCFLEWEIYRRFSLFSITLSSLLISFEIEQEASFAQSLKSQMLPSELDLVNKCTEMIMEEVNGNGENNISGIYNENSQNKDADTNFISEEDYNENNENPEMNENDINNINNDFFYFKDDNYPISDALSETKDAKKCYSLLHKIEKAGNKDIKCSQAGKRINDPEIVCNNICQNILCLENSDNALNINRHIDNVNINKNDGNSYLENNKDLKLFFFNEKNRPYTSSYFNTDARKEISVYNKINKASYSIFFAKDFENENTNMSSISNYNNNDNKKNSINTSKAKFQKSIINPASYDKQIKFLSNRKGIEKHILNKRRFCNKYRNENYTNNENYYNDNSIAFENEISDFLELREHDILESNGYNNYHQNYPHIPTNANDKNKSFYKFYLNYTNLQKTHRKNKNLNYKNYYFCSAYDSNCKNKKRFINAKLNIDNSGISRFAQSPDMKSCGKTSIFYQFSKQKIYAAEAQEMSASYQNEVSFFIRKKKNFFDETIFLENSENKALSDNNNNYSSCYINIDELYSTDEENPYQARNNSKKFVKKNYKGN